MNKGALMLVRSQIGGVVLIAAHFMWPTTPVISAEPDLNRWRFGVIEVDAVERTVIFPAKVQMAEGALEYGIVTPVGPVHESLLVAQINPVELHAAVLLLGVKVRPVPLGGELSGRLDAETLRGRPEIAGVSVSVRLSWKSGDEEKQAALEDWLVYSDGRRVAEGPWLYSGSYLQEGGHFAAQGEGSVLCLVTNPAALLNNPRVGHEDDHIWEVRSGVVPSVGTAVEVVIRVPKP